MGGPPWCRPGWPACAGWAREAAGDEGRRQRLRSHLHRATCGEGSGFCSVMALQACCTKFGLAGRGFWVVLGSGLGPAAAPRSSGPNRTCASRSRYCHKPQQGRHQVCPQHRDLLTIQELRKRSRGGCTRQGGGGRRSEEGQVSSAARAGSATSALAELRSHKRASAAAAAVRRLGSACKLPRGPWRPHLRLHGPLPDRGNVCQAELLQVRKQPHVWPACCEAGAAGSKCYSAALPS